MQENPLTGGDLLAVIEVELRNLLVEKDTKAEERIYPINLPMNPEYPAITYQQISNQGHHDIPVDYPRIQVTSWSPSLLEAKQLAEEVQAELQRFKGVLNGYRVKQIVKMDSPGDLYDSDAGEAGLYYVPVDYRIIYERVSD